MSIFERYKDSCYPQGMAESSAALPISRHIGKACQKVLSFDRENGKTATIIVLCIKVHEVCYFESDDTDFWCFAYLAVYWPNAAYTLLIWR